MFVLCTNYTISGEFQWDKNSFLQDRDYIISFRDSVLHAVCTRFTQGGLLVWDRLLLGSLDSSVLLYVAEKFQTSFMHSKVLSKTKTLIIYSVTSTKNKNSLVFKNNVSTITTRQV